MIYSQLRAFHFVATEGSFTRAANTLSVTQPTISMQVKELEEAYQVQLFNRRGQRIELTEMGRELLTITQRMFDDEQRAEELMSAARALEAGRLRIGTDSPIHIAPVIARFSEEYPGISLSLSTGSARTTMADLYDYRTDIALVADSGEEERLVRHPFSRDRLVAIVPSRHPLAQRSSVPLDKLLGERLVLRESGSVTRQIFEDAVRRIDDRISGFMEIGSREGVQEAIAAGLGVGIVSEAEVGRDRRIVVVAIERPTLTMTEYLVCMKDRIRLRVVEAFLQVAADLSAA